MPDVAIQFFRDSTSKHCTGKALNSTFTFSAISAREAEFPPHSTTWHGWCYISSAQNLSHACSWFDASEEGEMTTRPHLPLTTNPPPIRAKTCIPGIYHSQDKKWHRQLLSIATLERLSRWQVEEVLPVTQGLLTWDASFAPLACDWVFAASTGDGLADIVCCSLLEKLKFSRRLEKGLEKAERRPLVERNRI